MITTTARAILTNSLKLLGVIEPSEIPAADEAADSFTALNSLIDSWGTQPSSMYTITRSVTSCAAAASYTIGPGGNFNMARPNPFQIQRAGFIVPGTSGTTTEELGIPIITDDMYQALQMKAQENPQPTMLYYNPTNSTSAGFGTIYLWPILDQTVSIVLYIQQNVSQFADLTTEYLLVAGLDRALRYNLAVEIASLFERVPSPLILKTAAMALADYKRANMRMSDLPSDAYGITGNRRWGYNIQTGTGG
jgi:hypothetical protein